MIQGDVEFRGLEEPALRELLTIQQTDGAVTPARVVEAATPIESPLHSYFEWDNDTAAHQYRLGQARSVIQRVTVHLLSAPATVTRAFVSVERDDSRRYELLLSGPDILERRRQQFIDDLAELQKRMAEFREFAAAAEALREVVATLG